jgi:hypothetical protein
VIGTRAKSLESERGRVRTMRWTSRSDAPVDHRRTLCNPQRISGSNISAAEYGQPHVTLALFVKCRIFRGTWAASRTMHTSVGLSTCIAGSMRRLVGFRDNDTQSSDHSLHLVADWEGYDCSDVVAQFEMFNCRCAAIGHVGRASTASVAHGRLQLSVEQ